MDQQGTIVTWKDEKGFGFIQPVDGGKQIFFHIKEVQRASRRPVEGDMVYYRLGTGQDGRPCAQAVRIPQSESVRQQRVGGRQSENPLPFILMLFCLAASVHFFLRTHYPVPLLYFVVSGITYLVYGDDKNRAEQNSYRIPESSLHFLEMVGGWPGGYFAQQLLRHKTAKSSYQFFFWGIVMVHVAGWAYWLYWADFKKMDG